MCLYRGAGSSSRTTNGRSRIRCEAAPSRLRWTSPICRHPRANPRLRRRSWTKASSTRRRTTWCRQSRRSRRTASPPGTHRVALQGWTPPMRAQPTKRHKRWTRPRTWATPAARTRTACSFNLPSFHRLTRMNRQSICLLYIFATLSPFHGSSVRLCVRIEFSATRPIYMASGGCWALVGTVLGGVPACFSLFSKPIERSICSDKPNERTDNCNRPPFAKCYSFYEHRRCEKENDRYHKAHKKHDV